MSLYKAVSEGVQREIEAEKIPGVVIGVVSNNKDPDGWARVKVTFPWLSENEESQWARIVSFMAGNDRGAFFLPEVGDEVLVAFAHGDINYPYVIGALWNGSDKSPAKNSDGKNNVRIIKSRSGHVIKLDDKAGSEKIEITDKSGKNSVTWDTKKNTVSIISDKDIEITAQKGKIALNAKEIAISSSGDTTIEASGNMTVKGSKVNIN
jgi:uncharacterized protein involved in type VI secretion and phage assembly